MTAQQVHALIQESNAHRKAGRFADSARCAEIATRIDPKSGEAWLLLVAALVSLGSGDVSKAIVKALGALGPDDESRPVLEAEHANQAARHGSWQEAWEIIQRLKQRPGLHARQYSIIASVLSTIGDFSGAYEYARLAVRNQPDLPGALYNLGTVARYLGKFTEADAAFERLLEISPHDSLALASLVSFHKATPETNYIATLQEAARQTPTPSEDAGRIHHSLFKQFDELGRKDEAWDALQRGSDYAGSVFSFDFREKATRTDALMRTYPDPQSTIRTITQAPVGPRPIFIFGLPRSGTTLTERILASHSQVASYGEAPAIVRSLRIALDEKTGKHATATDVAGTAQLDWDRVAEIYLANLRFLDTGKPFFAEKTPHNYEYAGPMALAFPDAPLIHVMRNPMDSLFGAYRLQFGEGGYHWSYSLDDLAAYYRDYRRIMAHWKTVLGDRMLLVRLEEIVDDTEPTVRRILAHARLPFEEQCLTPETSEGGVSSASSSQVRQPINRQGIGRWRRYAEQLEPLRAQLEKDGFVDRNGDPILD